MLSRGEILAVDDDPDILEVISTALTREGFSVVKASTGEEALALVTAGDFDAMILDLMMPGIGGVSALREMKKIAPGVEAIVLTAHGSVDSAVECMRLGAFDYLKKPFGLEPLAAAVARAVAKKRFSEIASAAFTAETPARMAEIASAAAARLFGADWALLAARRREGLDVSGFGAAGSEITPEAADGICSLALARLEEAGAEVIQAESGPASPVPAGGPFLAVALPDGGRGAGVLCVGSPPGGRGFGEDDFRRARLLGPLVALALKNSQLGLELRQTRGQLLGAQKMEAMGMLAGQVAHDFNSLLGVIIGSVQLLQEDPSPGNTAKLSSSILDIAKNAAALISQMLAFTRGGEAPPGPVDTGAVLDESKLVLGKLAGRNVDVVYSMESGLPPVRIRPAHLKQVVFNLVVNARDSMPGGGRLRISARKAAAPGSLPQGLKAGSWVVLEVADDGGGIPAENIGRIFEPFFTTKADGKGTGLGLHIVQTLAREYGGAVTAVNGPGGGAVFSVYLPAGGGAA